MQHGALSAIIKVCKGQASTTTTTVPILVTAPPARQTSHVRMLEVRTDVPLTPLTLPRVFLSPRRVFCTSLVCFLRSPHIGCIVLPRFCAPAPCTSATVHHAGPYTHAPLYHQQLLQAIIIGAATSPSVEELRSDKVCWWASFRVCQLENYVSSRVACST